MAAHLNPNAALLLLSAGVLLIYVELNRPGWVVPGAIGLTAVLFGVASLARAGFNPGAFALVGTSVVLLGLGLRLRTPPVVAGAATLGLVLGFVELVRRPSPPIAVWEAVGCGLVLGASTSILTRIARRARANKGLD